MQWCPPGEIEVMPTHSTLENVNSIFLGEDQNSASPNLKMLLKPKVYQVRQGSFYSSAYLLNSSQFLVGVFASMGSVLYGYDLGVIAEVVACPTLESKFHPNSVQK